MIARVKQYFWIGLVIAAFYYLLNHHFFIYSYNDFDILKKVEPTLEHTFISLRQVNPMDLLQNDILVDAGVEDILLDRGLVSEQRLDQIFEQIDRMRANQKN